MCVVDRDIITHTFSRASILLDIYTYILLCYIRTMDMTEEQEIQYEDYLRRQNWEKHDDTLWRHPDCLYSMCFDVAIELQKLRDSST